MTEAKNTVTVKVEFTTEYPHEIDLQGIELHEIIRNPDVMRILNIKVGNRTLNIANRTLTAIAKRISKKIKKENKLGVA